MIVPNRNYQSPEYRYGFQGQEKDDEIKGSGNSINFKYRMHDPRIGRFFAIDPLTAKYPHYTPYSFSGNKVIHAIELEGLEEIELFHRTTPEGAAGILRNGFDSKYTVNGKFHFFSIKNTANGAGANVAKAPVQFGVKLDVTNAIEISKKQYSQWFREGLAELDYKGSTSELPKNIQSRADAIRNQKLWQHMKDNGGNLFKVNNGKGNFIAATDDILEGANISMLSGHEDFLKLIYGVKVPKKEMRLFKILKYGGKALRVLGPVAFVAGAYDDADTTLKIICVSNPKCNYTKKYGRLFESGATTLGRYDLNSQNEQRWKVRSN